jgi:hypothetical protein
VAKVDIKMPEEFLLRLSRLGENTDAICEKALEAGGELVLSKGNYQQRKRQITTALLNAGMAITDRRYIGHEDDTGYHHYAIDVAHHYELEE